MDKKVALLLVDPITSFGGETIQKAVTAFQQYLGEEFSVQGMEMQQAVVVGEEIAAVGFLQVPPWVISIFPKLQRRRLPIYRVGLEDGEFVFKPVSLLCEQGLMALMQTISLVIEGPWQAHAEACWQCRSAQPIVRELLRLAEEVSIMELASR